MKHPIIRTSVRFSVIGGAIFLVGLGGYRAFHFTKERVERYTTPQDVVVNFDHIYSQTLKREIEHYAQSSIHKQPFEPVTFCRDLKRKFGAIKQISWHMKAGQQAVCDVDGVQPRFLINDKLIVGNKRTILSRHTFDDFDAANLKPLEVNPALIKKSLPLSLCQFLVSVPTENWNKYAVSYINCNRVAIQIQNDERPLNVLGRRNIFSALHELSNEKLLALQKDFLIRKKLLDRKKQIANKKICYDVRFKNCVCVALRTGESWGENNG